MLPDLYASELAASKAIKVMFTGDLNRKIITNPFFFGTEKEHLRAVIARISFSTTLMPKGMYQLNEDDPRQIDPTPADDDGKKPEPSTQEMCKLSNWVHATSNIL